MDETTIRFTLNGKELKVKAAPYLTLLKLLREKVKLTGTKFGCGKGICGACTVLINGDAMNACLILAPQVDGKIVETIEGLSHGSELHPLQEAFIQKGAVQCGYCTPGMIMSAKALLDRTVKPTREEIKSSISGNLCRCTGYNKIILACEAAAKKNSES